jgi:hypothetical protein
MGRRVSFSVGAAGDLVAQASQAAEKRPCSVILSEAKNLSSI